MNDNLCHLISQIESLFNEQKIRYLSITHSPAYTENEIAINNYNLGQELIDGVLISLNNKEKAIVVVPSTRKISLDSLKKELNNNSVNFIGKKEIKRLYPECEVGAFPPLGGVYNLPVFFAKEVTQMKEVTFYLGTRLHRIRLKSSDFEKIVQPEARLKITTTPRYRAEIESLVPRQAKSSFKENSHCMIGYSLQNKNFTTAKLVGIIEWVSQNFSHCTVAIGDSIYRLTLQIKGVEAKKALHRALRFGHEVLENESMIFESYSDRCKFKLLLCSDIQKTESYRKYYNSLLQLFERDEKFSALLHGFADMFVDRRIELDESHFEFCVKQSCIYILEELAIIAYLSEQGVDVFVYPGALNFLVEIIEGLHPEAPEELKRLISISLRLKSSSA